MWLTTLFFNYLENCRFCASLHLLIMIYYRLVNQTWWSLTRTSTGSFPLLVCASVFKLCLKALFVKPPMNPAKTPENFFSSRQDPGALSVCMWPDIVVFLMRCSWSLAEWPLDSVLLTLVKLNDPVHKAVVARFFFFPTLSRSLDLWPTMGVGWGPTGATTTWRAEAGSDIQGS